MKVSIGYPSKEEESSILSRFQTANPVEELMAVASGKDIISIQDTVKQVFVDKTINNYIVEIVTKTRYHSDINLGASPRASLSLFRAAQAWAFYNGRSFVIPEDVKYMAIPVLSHRIVLKQEARLKKISAEEIISAILQTIKISLVDDYGKK
jgi:MoxR-like ATPase